MLWAHPILLAELFAFGVSERGNDLLKDVVE